VTLNAETVKLLSCPRKIVRGVVVVLYVIWRSYCTSAASKWQIIVQYCKNEDNSNVVRNEQESVLGETASFAVLEQNFECWLYNTGSILNSRVFLPLGWLAGLRIEREGKQCQMHVTASSNECTGTVGLYEKRVWSDCSGRLYSTKIFKILRSVPKNMPRWRSMREGVVERRNRKQIDS
jgi:hypothetical protein